MQGWVHYPATGLHPMKGTIMRHCPHCQQPTIPAWHAYLGSVFSKPITCPVCHSTPVRKIDMYDASFMLPMVIVEVFMFHRDYWDVTPPGLVWFMLGCSGLAGMCLWLHTIRYKVKTD
jgi:hypothetical protein